MALTDYALESTAELTALANIIKEKADKESTEKLTVPQMTEALAPLEVINYLDFTPCRSSGAVGYEVSLKQKFWDKKINVLIPSTYEGQPVLRIADSAFGDYSGCAIKSVIIPDSVKDISMNAFPYCKNLENIIVSSENNSYKSIDGNLYSKDGTRLIKYAIGKKNTSFTIPDGVTNISMNAFYLSALENVTIPDGVESIGEWAFAESAISGDLIIPESVQFVYQEAFFACVKLETVTFRGTPDMIDDDSEYGVFENCDKLEHIYVPWSVGAVSGAPWGANATIHYNSVVGNDTGDENKPNIQPLTITENGTYTASGGVDGYSPITVNVASSGGGEDIEIITYLDCAKIDGGYEITGLNDTSVTDIIIPSKCNGEPVIRIGDKAFGDWMPVEAGGNVANITSVIIQNGVREIGKFAFELCPLTSVTIANSVTKIDESAFAETLITSVVIPENVSYIGDFAFGASSLETVTFKGTPDTIDYQGDGVFAYCSNLNDIYVPWAEGEVDYARLGAPNATIHYNSEV